MTNRVLWSALVWTAAWSGVALACGPPAGERSTAVESAGAEVERFPVPPKRSEALGPGYYPDPLQGDGKS